MGSTSDKPEAGKECRLNSAEIPVFLSLVAEARAHRPNHPQTDRTYYVDVHTTAGTPVYKFRVLSSRNDGVQIRLYSQDKFAWNYGTLRNDALGPFLVQVFGKDQVR